MPVTRPTLAAASWRRRHGARTELGAGVGVVAPGRVPTAIAPGALADRPACDRSCYGANHAGPPVARAPLPTAGAAILRARHRPPRLRSVVPWTVLMMRSAHPVGEALRRGAEVSDTEFDQVYPEDLRDRSYLHWTPVAIAVRAAALLAPSPDVRVLDVGAGVGKLCLIGALVTGATWWGIEQDPGQIAAANHAAWALDIAPRTRFVHGDGSRLDWDEFDALYFYNPFSTVMLAPHASPFVRYATIQGTLCRIEQRLAATRPGTRVVTFHGFGGHLPAGFTRVSREPAGDDALELWIHADR